ncbi:MAG: plsX [Clostridiales bacterium]|jgi:glycerol-3-phosphate acyltransferase PlsX|nr:plsX [Clostridiales bacterium]
MKIIIDAMGGDNAPEEIVKGAVAALNEFNVEIILVGDESKIKAVLANEKIDRSKLQILHTTEIINNNDHPAQAIRKKKDSSMVVGMKMLKDGIGDAFISAGNTGALLAGGLFVVGRIKGVDRPGLAPIIPGKNGPFLLMDSGANAECKTQNILQFALMGEVYMKKVFKMESPSIGLVNIGAEEEKGTEFVKECHKLLKESNLNFKGNVEGRDIPEGNIDVVVCDGFTGNVILKVFEGVFQTIFDTLKEEIMSTTRTKIGGLLLKPVFRKFKKKFDYTEHGGAILLGVNGPVIKAHGSSNSKAMKNAVRQAVLCIEGGVVESIRNEIETNENNNNNNL